MIPACGFDRTPLTIREYKGHLASGTRDPPYFRQRDRNAPGDDGAEEMHILRLAGDHQFVIITIAQDEIIRVPVEHESRLAEIFADREFLPE
jgi:hypothetical protein